MTVQLLRLDPGTDRAELITFLHANRFPFHVNAEVSEAEAAQRIDRGGFDGPDNIGYWISCDDEHCGYVVFAEMDDGTPLIDLRLADGWRGQGIGSTALAAATDLVFRRYPDINRIEGNTREDNSAMRRVFQKCGYVKEAHCRDAWPVFQGHPLAAVAYAILRRDWLTGETTPVNWLD